MKSKKNSLLNHLCHAYYKFGGHLYSLLSDITGSEIRKWSFSPVKAAVVFCCTLYSLSSFALLPVSINGPLPKERENNSETVSLADRYLQRVILFVETMMEKGTDHYGTESSPLFAAMLNLDSMELAVKELPEEVIKKANAANGLPHELDIKRLAKYGFPPLPVGIRPTDRSPIGCNFEHDMVLLNTMYELTRVTGEVKFAEHANRYLSFWLEHCQSPVTGLMPSGEHMCWDFVHEQAFGNIRECYRKNPLWDKLYAINPQRAASMADAEWMSQIHDKKVGDYSRHASYHNYFTKDSAAYQRHAGFYIWDYANAYIQTRDPKYINRIEVLIESRTGISPEPYSVLVNQRGFKPENGKDHVLRLLIWDAAGLVPGKTDRWRDIVKQIDKKMIPQEIAALPTSQDAATPDLKNSTERILLTQGGKRTISQSLPVIWRASYGSWGVSALALEYLTRFKQTGDKRFMEMAITIAKRYVESGIPAVKDDLWPGICGQVISLCASLYLVPQVAQADQKIFLNYAIQVADMADQLFSKNGLFRADGTVGHYEAITGADNLCWGLLQLSCALKDQGPQPGHIDVNW